MKITNYHKITDLLMLKIEKKLDKCDNNKIKDYEINNGIMKIIFTNNNQILITRQESLKQIWLANNKNGYRFQYKEKKWFCIKSKKTIMEILKKLFLKETVKI